MKPGIGIAFGFALGLAFATIGHSPIPQPCYEGGLAVAVQSHREEAGHASRSPRSPRWAAVRKAYLGKHPACEACGSTEELQVHHVEPFHLHPEKELDPTNLITLCAGKHECHLRLGHAFNFKAYNPHVREDAALQRKRIAERKFE